MMPKTVGWRIRFDKSILLGMSQTDNALGKVTQGLVGWLILVMVWHVYTSSQVSECLASLHTFFPNKVRSLVVVCGFQIF